MTLPKNCNECNFLWFAKYKIPMCLLGEMIDDADSKPEWCPLSNNIQEKPHGHWTLIDKGHNFYDWECSICGGSGRGDYAFCPRCGAVMDEDIPMEYFENGGI